MRWFSWSGDKGLFQEYNKEEKKNYSVPLPFNFLVLDSLITVTGYNEPEKVGYYSNEVRNIKDKLTVRTKNGIEFEGEYAQVKEKLGAKGCDYCQSVYIMFFGPDKKPTLGNIKMKGAALGPWIELQKSNKVMEIGISVKSAKEEKKGKVVYQVPIFSPIKVSEASNQQAVELDKELQDYLTAYLLRNQSPTSKIAEVAIPIDTRPTVKVEESSADIQMSGSSDKNDLFEDDAPF